MGYVKQTWVDEAIGGEKMLYTLKNGADGSVIADDVDILAKTPIVQAGSPVSAARMNHIEEGISTSRKSVTDNYYQTGSLDTILDSFSLVSSNVEGVSELMTLMPTSAGHFYIEQIGYGPITLNSPRIQIAHGYLSQNTAKRYYYDGLWSPWKLVQIYTNSGKIIPTLLNGWQPFGTPYADPYYKVINSIVYVGGAVKGGSPTNSVVFQLHADYAPSGVIAFITATSVGTCHVQVYPSGSISFVAGGDAAHTSLNGICFPIS